MKRLLENIETLRKTMVNMGMDKGLSNPDVIKLSQKLDSLLNKYHKLGTRKVA
ncbi:MAG: aspartyl-phosphate phosphatase Spo0E family protein [Veillonellales bacterium]